MDHERVTVAPRRIEAFSPVRTPVKPTSTASPAKVVAGASPAKATSPGVVKSPSKPKPEIAKTSDVATPKTKSANTNTSSNTNTSTNTIANANPQRKGREYTIDEITEMLSSGYLTIHKALYEYIPVGSHVRYYKKCNPGCERRLMFRPGGFVKSHFVTAEGKRMMMIESTLGGKNGDPGYIAFPMAYDDIDELFKKYPRDAFIEIHLIYSSLAQKKKQIEDLENRIIRLERQLDGKRQ